MRWGKVCVGGGGGHWGEGYSSGVGRDHWGGGEGLGAVGVIRATLEMVLSHVAELRRSVMIDALLSLAAVEQWRHSLAKCALMSGSDQSGAMLPTYTLVLAGSHLAVKKQRSQV